MNNIQKRFLLFLIGCIGSRSLLAYGAKIASKTVLKIMGYIATIIGVGFLYIFATGSRKTGGETFGDKIWWNNLRPVHGLLYLAFAYYAIMGISGAWVILLIDVVLGLVAFLGFHYSNGDFNKLV